MENNNIVDTIKNLSDKKYKIIGTKLYKGLPVIGMNNKDLSYNKGVFTLGDTGIQVLWSNNVNKKGTPGWIVREIVYINSSSNDGNEVIENILYIGSNNDIYNIITKALLLATEKRIEIILE